MEINSILIEKDEGGYTASHKLTLEYGVGETEEEAVKDLLIAMTETKYILEKEKKLSSIMKEKLRLLRLYINITSTTDNNYVS